jgi:hypothetical protein
VAGPGPVTAHDVETQAAPQPAAPRRDPRAAAVAARLAARPRAAASAAAAAAPAPASVVDITIDTQRPSPQDIALRESAEDDDFSDRDPRRFNYRRVWSDGGDDVVAATDPDNWSSIEFRAFVWDNADGRGNDIFELAGTRDLATEFDPATGPVR